MTGGVHQSQCRLYKGLGGGPPTAHLAAQESEVNMRHPDRNMRPAQSVQSLDQLALSLHFKPEVHGWFEALARHYLRHADRRSISSSSYTSTINKATHENHRHVLIETATLNFLNANGPYLWPAYVEYRGHLTIHSPYGDGRGNRPKKPDREEGLMFVRDGSMTAEERKAWRKRNKDREPNDEENILESKIGKGMKAYFAKLVELGVVVARRAGLAQVQRS